MNSPTIQRICAYCGPVFMTMAFSGLFFSGFLPPLTLLPPSFTPDQVAAHYREHHYGILFGMNLLMISSLFVLPFVALVSEQMRRMEGAGPLLAYIQLAAGTMNVVGFYLPGTLFLVAAYRVDMAPDLLYLMNDMGWIFLVVPWPFQFVADLAIGAAILGDKSDKPIFPRWLGYFSLWLAMGLPIASLCVFFQDGPFAWNIFPYWVPGITYGIFVCVLTWALLRAIGQQELDSRTDIGGGA